MSFLVIAKAYLSDKKLLVIFGIWFTIFLNLESGFLIIDREWGCSMRSCCWHFRKYQRTFQHTTGLPYDVVSRSLSDGVKEAGGAPIVIPVASPDLAKDYIDMIHNLIPIRQ